jgi:AcrR family transcriptional regulator
MSSARQHSARAGRPRDPRIDTAVLRATLAILDESGYGQVSVEAVARRAKSTKSAIYRRWTNRQHLVLDALSARLSEAATPNTGCTICDLNEGINVFIAAFRQIRPNVLGPLLAECATDPDLRQQFMTRLFEPPRTAVAQMVDQAARRGDLRDGINRDLIVDLLGSFVHYRALYSHAPTTGAEAERAVEVLLQGIATDYTALLEHSRRLAEGGAMHDTHSD